MELTNWTPNATTTQAGEMRMDKLLLTVPEAAAALGIGRSQLYKLVLSGELRTIKIGRSRRIPIRALDELIELLTEAA